MSKKLNLAKNKSPTRTKQVEKNTVSTPKLRKPKKGLIATHPWYSPKQTRSGKRNFAGGKTDEHFRHPDQFGNWLGYQLLEIDRTKHFAVAYLPIRGDHLSPSGRVHGGVISSFFDYACGAAVLTTLKRGQVCSTIELKVNYLVPLMEGDSLTIKAEVVFRGKRLCVIRALAFRKPHKNPVAMASATFNVISLEKSESKSRSMKK